MPPTEFELTIPESERPKVHALDGAATGIGNVKWLVFVIERTVFSAL
jgi:hypothetical protein